MFSKWMMAEIAAEKKEVEGITKSLMGSNDS